MRKSFIVFSIFILSLFLYSPINVNALSISDTIVIGARGDYDGLTDDYNQEQTCTGSDSILGDPNDPDSVAWLLDKILSYATLAGIILVVVLSSIEFLKAIVKSDDETLGKAKKKLIMRFILVILLFFVPTITNAILDLFGLTSESTCGIGQ